MLESTNAYDIPRNVFLDKGKQIAVVSINWASRSAASSCANLDCEFAAVRILCHDKVTYSWLWQCFEVSSFTIIVVADFAIFFSTIKKRAQQCSWPTSWSTCRWFLPTATFFLDNLAHTCNCIGSVLETVIIKPSERMEAFSLSCTDSFSSFSSPLIFLYWQKLY